MAFHYIQLGCRGAMHLDFAHKVSAFFAFIQNCRTFPGLRGTSGKKQDCSTKTGIIACSGPSWRERVTWEEVVDALSRPKSGHLFLIVADQSLLHVELTVWPDRLPQQLDVVTTHGRSGQGDKLSLQISEHRL